jgi:signal transduction histidine kinase
MRISRGAIADRPVVLHNPGRDAMSLSHEDDPLTILAALDRAGVAYELFDARGQSVTASPSLVAALETLGEASDAARVRARMASLVYRALEGESVVEDCDIGEGEHARALRLSAVAVRGGGRTRAAVWLSDVSDAARAHARAQAHAARAARAEAAKDHFLATLSHELRTPLATILGWTQLLKGRTPEASTVESAVATIDRAARAQVRLIDDILVAARVVSGALRLDRRRVDLGQAVARAVDATRVLADGREVSLDLSRGERCMVDGDLGRLEHVTYHLLTNAVKFSPRGGVVRVRIAQDTARGDAVLEVLDDGTGIDPEVLPRVFERFTQGETGLTRRHGGLGLGLSLARHLIEAHGGTIRVDSEGCGRGTRVVVRLPLAEGGSESAP